MSFPFPVVPHKLRDFKRPDETMWVITHMLKKGKDRYASVDEYVCTSVTAGCLACVWGEAEMPSSSAAAQKHIMFVLPLSYPSRKGDAVAGRLIPCAIYDPVHAPFPCRWARSRLAAPGREMHKSHLLSTVWIPVV